MTGKYRGIWTGKQLVSMIVPDVNLNTEAKLGTSLNPKDETVVIDRVSGGGLVLRYPHRRHGPVHAHAHSCT